MRRVIRDLAERRPPDHAGLAYDVWAPFLGGEERDDQRNAWLSKVAELGFPADYDAAYARWEASFFLEGFQLAVGRTSARLLVGHGNPSPSQVGLTLHRTWGVPVIPGSALKGLTAHYVESAYGPEDVSLQGVYGPYRGAVRNEQRRLTSGPGDYYRALFGAPPAPDDKERGVGEARGFVEFHDALPLVCAAPGPFVRDVVTPHQSGYYRAGGGSAEAGDVWPNDYEDPKPVPFLAVRRDIAFLFAVSGPEEWAALGLRFAKEALKDWGVGGKTAAGYGRFRFDDSDEDALKQRRADVLEGRIAVLSPNERWTQLVNEAFREDDLLHLAFAVFKQELRLVSELCTRADGTGRPGAGAVQALRTAGFDEGAERHAFRAALIATGYVASWKHGKFKTPVKGVNLGKDKLKERAALVENAVP